MNYKPVLFLDFDGVLHPNGCTSTDCFCLLPALAATIAPFELDIVISSSWRHHYSLRWIKKRLPAALRKRIVGATGDSFPGTYARWKEIRAYLGQHPSPDWRALDDFDFEFPADCRELIYCDGARGCQSEQHDLLEAWLNEPAD